ncbi:hypothetical protein [Mesorhizobium sp. M0910]|uniref:hypothetical protein n=1 Tax=Mesorhizobium sp. M0910 TaxID=2957025 RepID=UPI003337C312
MIVAGQRLPILIATRPVDFRCGHQALALILEQGGFAWPKVQDGTMRLSRGQYEALNDHAC